jgi:DNA (cytosine-5)-methyltransferase 1
MIIVGVRNDLAARGLAPSHPQPTCARAIVVREAWHGLVNTPEECDAAKFAPSRIVDRLLYRMKPGESGDDYHPNGQLYGLMRLHPDRIAPTILRNGGAGGACEACHPSEHRRATIAEIKRLASFPDPFVLHGTFAERWAAVGNCVPPLFMRAIATHVRDLLSTAENGHAVAA